MSVPKIKLEYARGRRGYKRQGDGGFRYILSALGLGAVVIGGITLASNQNYSIDIRHKNPVEASENISQSRPSKKDSLGYSASATLKPNNDYTSSSITEVDTLSEEQPMPKFVSDAIPQVRQPNTSSTTSGSGYMTTHSRSYEAPVKKSYRRSALRYKTEHNNTKHDAQDDIKKSPRKRPKSHNGPL